MIFRRDRDKCCKVEDVTIPYSNCSESIKNSLFVSFSTLVPTTNANRGSGENHQLGHGKTDPVRKPCQIDGLSGQHVVGVAAGSHHCLALTEGGEVFGWGASIGREQGRGEGCIPVPTVLSEVSKSGVVYLSCGSHEVSLFPSSLTCCMQWFTNTYI